MPIAQSTTVTTSVAGAQSWTGAGRTYRPHVSYGWNYGRPGGWTGGVSAEDAGPSDHALLTAETLDRDA